MLIKNVTAFRIIDAHPTTAWRWVKVNLADLLVADVHECKRRLRVVTNYEEYRSIHIEDTIDDCPVAEWSK